MVLPRMFIRMIVAERTLIRYQMKTARTRGIISSLPIKRMKKTVTVIERARNVRSNGFIFLK